MNTHKGQAERTVQRIGYIRKVWKVGMSAQQIADAIANQFGDIVTRRVVIGIYSRNRVELASTPLPTKQISHPSIAIRDKRRREAAAKREKRKLASIARALEAAANPKPKKVTEKRPVTITEAKQYDATAILKTLFELEANECRWPISGSKADMLFCGHPSQGTYCAHHHRRSVGEGTISERNAENDLRRAA